LVVEVLYDRVVIFGAGEEVILVPHVAIEADHHPTGTGISLQHLGGTENKEVGVPLCLLYPSLGVQVLLLLNAKVPLKNSKERRKKRRGKYVLTLTHLHIILFFFSLNLHTILSFFGTPLYHEI